MNLDLKNKNAIVCGSTQGIGEASAIELAKKRKRELNSCWLRTELN